MTCSRKSSRFSWLLWAYSLGWFVFATAVDLDCDPCIDRSTFRLTAILPQNVASLVGPLEQTALDMNVALDVLEVTDAATLRKALDQTTPQALVVTVTDNLMAETLSDFMTENPDVPVFGWGWGYESLATSTLGWMATDATASGRLASQELQRLVQRQVADQVEETEDVMDQVPEDVGVDDTNATVTDITNITTTAPTDAPTNAPTPTTTTIPSPALTSVALIHDDTTALSGPTKARWNAILAETTTAANAANSTLPRLDMLPLDATTPETLFEFTRVMRSCPYQTVLVAEPQLLSHVLKLDCDDMIVGVFLDDWDSAQNAAVYQAITRQQVAFAMNPQVHLQVTLAVLMASVYITTEKVVAMPIQSSTYWTGPQLINARNVPSDTAAACEQAAFPVCEWGTSQAFSWQQSVAETPKTESNDETDVSTSTTTCACTERRQIRIGGVLHGDTTDAFWDPVFASAHQAALDMHIQLDLERFQRQDPFSLIYDQMAARIRNLCDSGIDALFVTIPDPVVRAAVQRCVDLRVPVVSVNSGQEDSASLGLVHHIGQDEYSGGYGGAVRLIAAGMTRGCKLLKAETVQ